MHLENVIYLSLCILYENKICIMEEEIEAQSPHSSLIQFQNLKYEDKRKIWNTYKCLMHLHVVGESCHILLRDKCVKMGHMWHEALVKNWLVILMWNVPNYPHVLRTLGVCNMTFIFVIIGCIYEYEVTRFKSFVDVGMNVLMVLKFVRLIKMIITEIKK